VEEGDKNKPNPVECEKCKTRFDSWRFPRNCPKCGADSSWYNNVYNEQSCTGGVAGYMTPKAFTKNKKGSPRGIEAAKKYGTVVGEAPRV
jgi:hypothetical protein